MMTQAEKDVVATARTLRAAQRAYMEFRKAYPEGHAVREQAGKLVETAGRELDHALSLVAP